MQILFISENSSGSENEQNIPVCFSLVKIAGIKYGREPATVSVLDPWFDTFQDSGLLDIPEGELMLESGGSL